MRYLILVLMLTASFSQELEVEGNLKVQGNIDASNQRVTNVGSPSELTDAVNTEFLQDALRDDGNYEYKIIATKIIIGLSTASANNEITISIILLKCNKYIKHKITHSSAVNKDQELKHPALLHKEIDLLRQQSGRGQNSHPKCSRLPLLSQETN